MRNVIPLTRSPKRSARCSAPATQTYTPEEVARMLGLSLAGTYIHLRTGDIPAKKVGARWIISRKAFHAWLDAAGDEDEDVR